MLIHMAFGWKGNKELSVRITSLVPLCFSYGWAFVCYTTINMDLYPPRRTIIQATLGHIQLWEMRAVVHNLVPIALMKIVRGLTSLSLIINGEFCFLSTMNKKGFLGNHHIQICPLFFPCRVESMQTKFGCITCYTRRMGAVLQRSSVQTM